MKVGQMSFVGTYIPPMTAHRPVMCFVHKAINDYSLQHVLRFTGMSHVTQSLRHQHAMYFSFYKTITMVACSNCKFFFLFTSILLTNAIF